MSSQSISSMIFRNIAAFGGASKGCEDTWTCSLAYSAGDFSSQGTSARTPRQVLLARHIQAGNQVTPDSISTTLRRGNSTNTPSEMRLFSTPANPVDHEM